MDVPWTKLKCGSVLQNRAQIMTPLLWKCFPGCACLPHQKGKPKGHLPFNECCVGGVCAHVCVHVCISHICGCDQWITMLATRVTRQNTELERWITRSYNPKESMRIVKYYALMNWFDFSLQFLLKSSLSFPWFYKELKHGEPTMDRLTAQFLSQLVPLPLVGIIFTSLHTQL